MEHFIPSYIVCMHIQKYWDFDKWFLQVAGVYIWLLHHVTEIYQKKNPKYVKQQCICFPAFNVARYLLLGQLQEIGKFFQQQWLLGFVWFLHNHFLQTIVITTKSGIFIPIFESDNWSKLQYVLTTVNMNDYSLISRGFTRRISTN